MELELEPKMIRVELEEHKSRLAEAQGKLAALPGRSEASWLPLKKRKALAAKSRALKCEICLVETIIGYARAALAEVNE